MNYKKEIELAWAAGFFDGEGTSYAMYGSYKSRKDGIRRKYNKVYLALSVGQKDKRPLERFQKAVGNVGNIKIGNGQGTCSAWRVCGTKAEAVIKLLLPYLSEQKLEQYWRVKELMPEDELPKYT